jgi:NHLM bacteriocin system ABC transporter peptidase/ATP-binding protein
MKMPFLSGGRVATPVVLQMERAECGAASLAMVLGYHGLWKSLEDLRQICGVSRDGSRADSIVRAAESFGLKASGVLVSPEAASRLPVPFIAFWNGNHFVTIEGIGSRHAWVNDPAIGRRRLSRAQFDADFAGIALLFEKGPQFRRGGQAPSLMGGLKERLGGLHGTLGFIGLLSLIMVVPGILTPSFRQLFVDFFLIREYEHWLYPLLYGLAAAAAVQALLTIMQQRYLTRLENRLSVVWASQLVHHLLRLPVAYFGQRNPAELSTRGGSADGLARLLSGSLGSAGLSLPSIVFFGAVIASYDMLLGLVGLGFTVLNLVVLKAWAASLAERNQSNVMDRNRLAGVTMNGLRMIDEYRASGTEWLLFERITGLNAQVQQGAQDLARSRAVLQALPTFLSAAAGAAVLVIGGLEVMAGDLTIGMLVAVQALMISFLGPVGQLIGLGGRLQDAQAYIQQVDDLMKHPEATEFSNEAPAIGGARQVPIKLTGQIAIDDVSFGYSALQPALLKDFTLTARSGSWIAITGRSGSGKSTLARVLSGLEDPWSGEVRLDGVPLRHVPRDLLRRSVAVVDQSISLFEGSLRDNISLWDPTLPDDRVVSAASTACFHDIAIARTGGYTSRLTENGANLSGGQRALLELARALAMEPSILVLDEATAALDAVTEARVMANLRQLGCTCIVIAHRVSTIRDADEIIVLERGAVVQRGQHAGLMAEEEGLYRQLVASA